MTSDGCDARKRVKVAGHTYRSDAIDDGFETQPTLPLASHNMLKTQTQPLTTQPTHSWHLDPQSSDVLVERSSPTPPGSPVQLPTPRGRCNAGSLLARSLGPPGTTFHPPTKRPAPDSDSEDMPVHHSSDDGETQGDIQPTNFTRGGRAFGLANIPESPATLSDGRTFFKSLLDTFSFQGDNQAASATPSRGRRAAQQWASSPVRYTSIQDVPDASVRGKVKSMLDVFPTKTIDACYNALARHAGNYEQALRNLRDASPSSDTDELASATPPARRGLLMSKQQPRTVVKQQVKVPSKTIAEKYGVNQKPLPSTSIEVLDYGVAFANKKRRRLTRMRPNTVSSSPLGQASPKSRGSNVEEEFDSGIVQDQSEADEAVVTAVELRLLKFLNECTIGDLVDLSAQPERDIRFLLDSRPFSTLDAVREVKYVGETKSGKKSKARPLGDKVVDICLDTWKGYNAVDELVAECEKLAKPIQSALKGWGIGDSDGRGELHMMKLDETQDSGIGTPLSSCRSSPGLLQRKSRFLQQPSNMGEVELKDYQLVGLNWLNLLWSQKLSCILADDMGLGKTCQVIAFLAHLQQQKVDGVHLVIVPGSTLENWLREFARFAPSLNVVPYYGSQSQRYQQQEQIDQEFDSIDVVVTTYDMSVKPIDNKFLRKLEPAVCVYDEAHQLRNPTSNRYEQLTRIKSDFRILLTGTPLQNNLQELVSILAFIMPDMFKDKRDDLNMIFKHKASTKESNHAALLSAERIDRARMMMTPFILRRKKLQVLDLPTKHSRIEWCQMTNVQAECYNGSLNEARRLVTEGKKHKGGRDGSSNLLMALRMAALHPLLARRLYDDKIIDKIVKLLAQSEEYGGNSPEKIRAYLTDESNTGVSLKGGDYALHRFCADPHRPFLHKYALKNEEWMDSGKVQKFKELVGGYAANGDRVLVFSQFTTLMDILEAVLETLQIKFMRLDGSTPMDTRQDMIDQFTRDESISVFLLSTKAGGAGINLACANKVIIFDSGFNPQDDVQAENRAHRVGQTREVEVVRMVTKGTIEEQIHALGASKLALDERVAGEGEDGPQAEKNGEDAVKKMLFESLEM